MTPFESTPAPGHQELFNREMKERNARDVRENQEMRDEFERFKERSEQLGEDRNNLLSAIYEKHEFARDPNTKERFSKLWHEFNNSFNQRLKDILDAKVWRKERIAELEQLILNYETKYGEAVEEVRAEAGRKEKKTNTAVRKLRRTQEAKFNDTEVRKAQKELADAAQKVRNAQKDLDASEAKTLRAELAAKEAELKKENGSDLISALKSLVAPDKVKELEKKVASLQHLQATISAKQTQLDGLKNEVQSIDKKEADLKKLDDTADELDITDPLSAKEVDLEATAQAKRNAVDAVDAPVRTAEEKTKEIERINEKLRRQKQTVRDAQALNEELKVLRPRKVELTKPAGLIGQAAKEIDDLKMDPDYAKLADFQSELGKAKTEKTERITKLETEKTQLQAKLKDLEKPLNDAKLEEDKLKNKVNVLLGAKRAASDTDERQYVAQAEKTIALLDDEGHHLWNHFRNNPEKAERLRVLLQEKTDIAQRIVEAEEDRPNGEHLRSLIDAIRRERTFLEERTEGSETRLVELNDIERRWTSYLAEERTKITGSIDVKDRSARYQAIEKELVARKGMLDAQLVGKEKEDNQKRIEKLEADRKKMLEERHLELKAETDKYLVLTGDAANDSGIIEATITAIRTEREFLAKYLPENAARITKLMKAETEVTVRRAKKIPVVRLDASNVERASTVRAMLDQYRALEGRTDAPSKIRREALRDSMKNELQMFESLNDGKALLSDDPEVWKKELMDIVAERTVLEELQGEDAKKRLDALHPIEEKLFERTKTYVDKIRESKKLESMTKDEIIRFYTTSLEHWRLLKSLTALSKEEKFTARLAMIEPTVEGFPKVIQDLADLRIIEAREKKTGVAIASALDTLDALEAIAGDKLPPLWKNKIAAARTELQPALQVETAEKEVKREEVLQKFEQRITACDSMVMAKETGKFTPTDEEWNVYLRGERGALKTILKDKDLPPALKKHAEDTLVIVDRELKSVLSPEEETELVTKGIEKHVAASKQVIRSLRDALSKNDRAALRTAIEQGKELLNSFVSLEREKRAFFTNDAKDRRQELEKALVEAEKVQKRLS